MAAPVPDREFTVRPEWIDHNGHMNVGYFVVAFDFLATDPFYEWLGIGESYTEASGMSVYTLSSATSYLAELFEGDAGHFETRLLDADEKRVHYFHEMFHSDGRLVATNELLGMNVDLESRRSTPFPEDAQTRIADLVRAHGSLPIPPQAGRPIGIRTRPSPGA